MKSSLGSLKAAATVFELTDRSEIELQIAGIFRYDDDGNNNNPKEMCFFYFSMLKWGIEGILFFKAHPSSASDKGYSFLGCFLLNEPDRGSAASILCLGAELGSGSSFCFPLPPYIEVCGPLWAQRHPAGVSPGGDILWDPTTGLRRVTH